MFHRVPTIPGGMPTPELAIIPRHCLLVPDLSEVTISLEHLRGLDPGTRIVYGYGLDDFTDAERRRLPRDESPAAPATIFESPFNPANPRRFLRTSADD